MSSEDKKATLDVRPVVQNQLQMIWSDSEAMTKHITSLAWCSDWIDIYIKPDDNVVIFSMGNVLETNQLFFYHKKAWTSPLKPVPPVTFRVGTADLLDSFKSNEQSFLIWSHIECCNKQLHLIWSHQPIKDPVYPSSTIVSATLPTAIVPLTPTAIAPKTTPTISTKPIDPNKNWQSMICFPDPVYKLPLKANSTTATTIQIDQPNLFHFILTRLAIVGSLFRISISDSQSWILLQAHAPEAELRYLIPTNCGGDSANDGTSVLKKKKKESHSWISVSNNNAASGLDVPDDRDRLYFYEQYATVLLEWVNPERWQAHTLASADVRQILSSFPTRILWSLTLQEGLNISVSAIKITSDGIPVITPPIHSSSTHSSSTITLSSLTRLCQSGFEYTAKTAVLNQLIKYYEEKYPFLSTNQPKCSTSLHDSDDMCKLHRPKLPIQTVSKQVFSSFQSVLDSRTIEKTDELLEKEFQLISEFQSYLESIPSWLIIRLERIETIAVYTNLVLCKSVWVLPIEINTDKATMYVQRIWVFDKNVDNGNGMTGKDVNYIQQLQLQSPLYVPQIFAVRLPGSKHLRLALGMEESFFITMLHTTHSSKKKKS